MIVSADDHIAILNNADRLNIPLTFAGRGEIMLLEHVWVDVPYCLSATGRMLLRQHQKANGASIPRPAWSIVGHPFMDDVLVPSLVHDVLCGTKLLPSRVVHWGFYQMLLWHNATRIKAETMYAAVKWGGPRFRGVQP